MIRGGLPHKNQPCEPLTGDRALTADVARGVCRHLAARGFAPLLEFTLGNGRRADVAGLDDKGTLIIVEIKVSVSDFKGDTKWTHYLDYCDQFYFAVPNTFPRTLFEADSARPHLTGVMIADRFDAAIIREAAMEKITAPRRRAESLRFARKAALRLQQSLDPIS